MTSKGIFDKKKPKIILGDALKELDNLEDGSVHLVITDPPYFLDGLDEKWKKGRDDSKRGTGAIGGLPVGMKFDPGQGERLQNFIKEIGKKLFEVMVPGAFAVVFSQPRLVHRMAMGLEEAQFEIRDMFAWHFKGKAQFKAFSHNHFIDKMDMSESKKNKLKKEMRGFKTAQLRPQFESIILAQKPKKGTLVQNWRKFRTGFMYANETLDGKAPNTVMLVEKPPKKIHNYHLTVKPLDLTEHLIKLFSSKGQMVLDPFLGSGTTALAAQNTGRECIGIEINSEYAEIAEKRIDLENRFKDIRKRMRDSVRKGVFHLEEAVLDVLLEACYENECLGPAEISRRSGIYRERGSENIMNDAIVIGILTKLASQNRVERCKQQNGRGGWELTKKEFESRRDDIR